MVMRWNGDRYGHGSNEMIAWYFDEHEASAEADRRNTGRGWHHVDRVPGVPVAE